VRDCGIGFLVIPKEEGRERAIHARNLSRALVATPSPLNGERVGVRGENVAERPSMLNYSLHARRASHGDEAVPSPIAIILVNGYKQQS